jgi:Na+/proline symporter
VGGFGTVDIVVVIGYLMFVACLGIYQAMRIKTAGDFFAGGRKFNKFFMVMHALGAGTHADDPVGVTGACYERGISGIWYTYAYLFCTPFYWLMAPFFRRSRFLTTADFFEARYGKSLGALYTIMAVINLSVMTGTLLKGTGQIAEAVTQGIIPERVAIYAMTAVFMAYGLAGGLMATVVNEAIQGLLIVVMSLLLLPFGLNAIGGFAGLHELVAANKFSLAAPEEITPVWIVVASFMMLIGIAGQPHIMEVCSAGKTEFEGRVGFTYGNFIKRFCAMGWAFAGLIVIALVVGGRIPELGAREEAFGVAIRVLLPTGMTGLMFAAILAAQMSTLSAFMVDGSALLSRNIYGKYIAPTATDRQILQLGRWFGPIIVGLGMFVAFVVARVTQGLTIFWALSSLMGVFVWSGVLWRKTNATGVWVSFVVMFIPWLVLGKFGPMLLKPLCSLDGFGWIGGLATEKHFPLLVACYLPAGLVALVVGSLLAKPRDPKMLDNFYMLLKTPVGQEQKLVDAGVNIVYAGSSEAHPWETNHPNAVNWGGFLIALAFSAFILLLLFVLTRIGA